MQVKTKAARHAAGFAGRQTVVYTVNEAVMTADKSEFVTQIWLASTDGKENYQLTFGDKSSTNPKWSPDGNWIAFTSNRKDNKNNLYVLRVARRRGRADHRREKRRRRFRMVARRQVDRVYDDRRKVRRRRKERQGQKRFSLGRREHKLARLYVIPVAKDANGKREPKKLTNDNRHVTGFNWSPDGTRIVFNHVSIAGRERLAVVGRLDRRGRDRQGDAVRRNSRGRSRRSTIRPTENGSRASRQRRSGALGTERHDPRLSGRRRRSRK